MSKMTLPAEAGLISGGEAVKSLCASRTMRATKRMQRVDPVFGERRFNPAPVRIIIDKQGKVKHVHFLSAFPDQVKHTDALFQWHFRPYLRDGKPVEVETGIMFGRAPRPAVLPHLKP